MNANGAERPAGRGLLFRRVAIGLTGLAVFIFAIWGLKVLVPHSHESGNISEHVLFAIAGSTSLGDQLMPKLAQAFLRDEMKATETGVIVDAKDALGHSRLRVWGQVPGRAARQVIEIDTTESSTAFQCLGTERPHVRCDIGMASRPINDRDEEAYPGLRKSGARLKENVVALDAVAVIVNPTNPVSQLSIKQLRAIYTGAVRNWNQVGGQDAPIAVLGRDAKSGTFQTFTQKVVGSGVGARGVKTDHDFGDSELMVKAVMQSPNAIGYVSMSMTGDARILSISDANGPGISPTRVSLATEDYPISRRLFLYQWDSPGSLVNAFVQYIAYSPGQALARETPFVDMTPKLSKISVPSSAPRAYRAVASHYSRIGLNFVFADEAQPGMADEDRLDDLGKINILRLRVFLEQHGATGDDVMLLSFADPIDDKSRARNLADARAAVVVNSLKEIGVIVPPQNALTLGKSPAVAFVGNGEGERKNKRVEIWIRDSVLKPDEISAKGM